MIPETIRLARYVGNGRVEIVEEQAPTLPQGGLLVKTEACGLCSGELMAWYMDRKLPHVLGHEVSGSVMASNDDRFPIGSKVFVHHHAPCGKCEMCRLGRPVHCAVWKRTKLKPGGMGDLFAVEAENLADTLRTDDLRPIDAALIEPVACVEKALRIAGTDLTEPNAVIGLGFMGLVHSLLLPNAVAFEVNQTRIAHAQSLGINAKSALQELEDSKDTFESVFVCPGSQKAFDLALSLVRPGGTIVMFAPLAPTEDLRVPQAAYFKDVRLLQSYSCGPEDTKQAFSRFQSGKLRAEQLVDRFAALDELPDLYVKMRDGEILKPMVVF